MKAADYAQVTVCSQSFPARLDQVREARRLIGASLAGHPVADDAVLCVSELASNSVLHSASGQPGGTFTVRTEVRGEHEVLIEVTDDGGRWVARLDGDDRPHGLDLVRMLAFESGVRGDPLTGWISWARLNGGGARGVDTGD